MYHTEFIFFEIMYFYYNITGKTTLSLTKLQNAFNTLQKIINDSEDIKRKYNFEDELTKILDNYPDYFWMNDNDLEINEDFELVYDVLLIAYPTLTPIDYDIKELIHNMKLYKDLDLTIPITETKPIFNLSTQVFQLYLKLAEKDFQGIDYTDLIPELERCIQELDIITSELDDSELAKIQMVCTYFEDLHLSNKNKSYYEEVWETILFGKNPNALEYLMYDKACFLATMQHPDENSDSIEIEEQEDNLSLLLKISDIPFFLTYFLVRLNQYINNHRTSLTKEALESLLIKKYLLLSIPDLEYAENYLIENHTIDTLVMPTLASDAFTDNSFAIFDTKVIECALSMDCKDRDIKKDKYLYAKLITQALFIRTFLELSQDENKKQSLINIFTKSFYYHDPDYKITSSLIDEIIFQDHPKLTR